VGYRDGHTQHEQECEDDEKPCGEFAHSVHILSYRNLCGLVKLIFGALALACFMTFPAAECPESLRLGRLLVYLDTRRFGRLLVAADARI